MEGLFDTKDIKDTMVRFRLPKQVYKALAIEAAKRDMKPNQFMLKLLKQTAERIEQRAKDEINASIVFDE